MGYQDKRILLLDGYTSQCLEYLKSMRAHGCHTTVLCNSRLDVCYASRYPDCKILGVCTHDQIQETEKCVLGLVKSGKYDLVIAFTEYSALILAHHKVELSKFAKIIINDSLEFDQAQDKNFVMKLCMDKGIPCPFTIFGVSKVEDVLSSNISFPVVIKPSHGFGARGFHKIATPKELENLVKERQINLEQMVIQECLPSDSLAVSANIFIDRYGKIQSSFLYKSPRFYPLEGGSGVLNITCDMPEVHKICANLVNLLNLRGPVGVDLMIDSRTQSPKVIEVNVRPIACARSGFLAGVDQAQQVLEDAFCDYVTPMMSYKEGVAVRRSQIDVLWFLKSPDRFKAKPSWFSWKNTKDQLFTWRDPLPWFAFSLNGVLNYRKELKARS